MDLDLILEQNSGSGSLPVISGTAPLFYMKHQIFFFLYISIFLGCTTSPNELLIANQLVAKKIIAADTAGISPIFTDEVQHWGNNILVWANEWELDPNLVATVMQIESCGDPLAVSRSNAQGLFQVMPYHFDDDEYTLDPNTNASRGMGYLKLSLDSSGQNTYLALAGYNGGISNARNATTDWNAEMKRYVYWGDNIYQDAVSGKYSSDTLDEWLQSGGASLCGQASEHLGLD